MSSIPPVLVLSGASEVITIALIEELLNHQVPVILVSQRRPSIVRDAANVIRHVVVDWPPTNEEASFGFFSDLVREFETFEGAGLHAFATEDGGLRFLIEAQRSGVTVTLSGAMALKNRGLDKAELFEFLQGTSESGVARSHTIRSRADLKQALADLGRPLVLKAALRGYDPGAWGSTPKIRLVTTDDDAEVLVGSDHLVGQEWLSGGTESEAVYWGIRDANGTRGVTARTLAKHPIVGGTSCWVRIEPDVQIDGTAMRLAEALDIVGLFELEFVSDSDGIWKMIEVNVRPWLQYGLASRAGLHMAAQQVNGVRCQCRPQVEPTSWVNLERMALRSLGPSSTSNPFGDLYRSTQSRPYWAPYSSTLSGVRRRWLRRNLGTLVRRLMP